jgi:integrase/recombinase XerD
MSETKADAGSAGDALAEDRKALLNAYLADFELRGMTKHTIEGYASNLRHFLRNLEGPVEGADIPQLRGYLSVCQKKTQNPRTLALIFSAVASLYDYLVVEGKMESNPVAKFRRRYLGHVVSRKNLSSDSTRKLISVDEMKMLVQSVVDPRNQALLVLLAKTGVRRNELLNIDCEDINWRELSVELKPTKKRTNGVVFFDDEAGRVLKRWLRHRESYARPGEKALFVNQFGKRLDRNSLQTIVAIAAEKVGLHNPGGKTKDRFTAHCMRHWFTTHLMRSGMKREYVKELRGDSRHEAMDIYYHIDLQELRDAYRASIPQLDL